MAVVVRIEVSIFAPCFAKLKMLELTYQVKVKKKQWRQRASFANLFLKAFLDLLLGRSLRGELFLLVF